MLVIRPPQTGGPEVMQLSEEATPSPGPQDLLVRVEAAGVNFIDIYHRSGQYPMPLPIPLGLEGAGVVEAAGSHAEGFSVGDRVAWASAPGSYATHVLVHSDRAVIVPDGVDTKMAAAVMLQGMTAHYLARSTFRLGKDDSCVVHAAAGGVGLLLCQIAKRMGARVIGTVSTQDKADLAARAGADEVIITSDKDFLDEVRRLTSNAGVSVVYDGIGKDTFLKSIDALRPRGMLVLYGQASGAVAPLDPQVLAKKGSLFLTRPALHHYIATRKELVERATELFGWIKNGELEVTVGETFALADAHVAHERLASRKTVGKLLLLP